MRASLIAPEGASLPAQPATITAHTHLRASGVTKDFGEGPVLRDVSVTASAGDCLAIIGDNGVGKSTLLRILGGAITPDAGEVFCTTTRLLVDQELVAPPGTTVGDLLDETLAPAREAIAVLEEATSRDVRDGDEVEAALAQVSAIDAWTAERRLDADLVRAEVAHPRDTLLETLSPGQRYRLRLTCALHVPGGAILLDEPSNHLDDAALDRLARRLREYDGIVVVVSHDRWLLAQVATAFLDLDPSSSDGPRAFRGTFADLRAERARELGRWRAAYAASVAEAEHLEQELERAQEATPDAWRPEKGTGRHTRASRAGGGVRMLRRRLDEAVAARPPIPPDPLRFELPALPEGTGLLIEASGLAVRGRLAQPKDAPIALAPSGRLVVTGPNGAGKSTLLSMLAGEIVPDAGELAFDPAARIGWLRQEPSLPPRATPLQVLAPLAHGGDRTRLREAILRTGLLAERDLGRPLRLLSVGQRQRVAIAAVLLRQPSVLLLDEPTNHLSVTLVDELGEALLHTPAAVVLVTHDRALRAATRGWPQLVLGAPPT
jgi:macrolide transport system ATP-binding/permease protein